MSGLKHIEDKAWLQGVRSDLESVHTDWVRKTPSEGLSKLDALTRYLDTILTELGCPPEPHACPTCGLKHDRPQS